MNIVEEIAQFNKFGSKLGLERIGEMLERLGNPQDELKVFHVAGTNGKGSVCKYIYEVMRAAGYKVGLFISPFIEVFNERIQIAGENIKEDDLEKYGRMVIDIADAMVKEGWDSPTEFEVVTAIALKYFADMRADYVVLEVGLGGRGDSTNVIKEPLASIISSISYDHMDRLGETIEEIATEKAGIIKKGVPVFINVEKEDAKKVIAREAYGKGCALYDFSDSNIYDIEMSPEGMIFDVLIKGKHYGKVAVKMVGEHQCGNAVTAIGTIEILRQKGIINIDENALGEGLKKAFQPARFEILESHAPEFMDKYFVLDGAHNEEGMETALKALDDVFYGKKTLVIAGILRDKDVDAMIAFMREMSTDFITVPVPNPRTLTEKELAEKLRELGKNAISCSSAAEGFKIAMSKMDEYDVCLCVGSLYLAGEVRRLIRNANIFKVEG